MMPMRYVIYCVVLVCGLTLAALLVWTPIRNTEPLASWLSTQVSFQQTQPDRDRHLNPFDVLNFDNLKVPKDRLLSGGPPVDGIPSLTNPSRNPLDQIDDTVLTDNSRVAQVVINDEAVAYPLAVLNFHEIANDTVGGIPVAVTYCPLCDSVSVFDRRVSTDEGKLKTLEFGVSGLLLNSNVVMYDRTDKGLWSQGMMEAISGPHAGFQLKTLPVQVTTLGDFSKSHPHGKVISTETGHNRNYARNPYKERGYFDHDQIYFPVPDKGDKLSPKTLGIGIAAGKEKIFVPESQVKESSPLTIETEKGPVITSANKAGLFVMSAPDDVQTMQVFYFAWSAFHPTTTIYRQ